MKRLILLSFLLAGCSSETDARRALEGAGYSQVKTTGYRFFGCGLGDGFHTGFTAIGPSGKEVSGVVCSAYLKGTTIRMD